MKPVMQTRFGTEGEDTGDCFAASIASIFEVPIEEVPHCENWPEQWNKTCAWLADRGFVILEVDSGFHNLGYHVRSGSGPRGVPHAVVAYGDRIIHDPHPDGTGLLSNDRGWCFAAIDPCASKV